MCDICVLKCEGCGCEIPTHIGDFSVDREAVAAFCPRPRCRRAAVRALVGFFSTPSIRGLAPRSAEHGGKHIVFADSNHDLFARGQGRSRRRLKGAVLYVVELPRDIHCNW